MKLLVIKSVIVLTTIFTFSGCALKTDPLEQSEYNKFDTIYEVTYDLKCQRFKFIKGDRFPAYDVGGRSLDNPGAFGERFILPKDVLALHIREDNLTGKQHYALVYPNGHFAVSNSGFALTMFNDDLMATHATCKIINGQALFKAVKVSNITK